MTDNGSQALVDATTTIGNADGRSYKNGGNAAVTPWAAANNTDATTFSRVNVA